MVTQPFGNLAQEFIARAQVAATEQDFGAAEEYLGKALRSYRLTIDVREDIYRRLAELSCQQGSYRAGARWYLEAMQSKSRRMPSSADELQSLMRSYKQALEHALEADNAISAEEALERIAG